MGSIPFLKEGEGTEFSFCLAQCGAGLCKGAESDLRQWIPQLNANPALEFRARISGEQCLIFVREGDWRTILTDQRKKARKEGKQRFWKFFPKGCILTFTISLSGGAVFIMFAFILSSVFGLKANYWHAFAWGAGIIVALAFASFAYDYATAMEPQDNR